MPMEAWGPEAIESHEDDKGVSFQPTKFRTSNDVDLFLSLYLKISIAYVSGPDISIIELG